jgi:hypothetical protein
MNDISLFASAREEDFSGEMYLGLGGVLFGKNRE